MVEFFPQAENDEFILGTLTFIAPAILKSTHVNHLTLLPEYVIAGGFALSAVAGLSINYDDIDIWMTGDTETAQPIGMYHHFASEWANTYTYAGVKLQIMKTRHRYPIDVIKAFDMSICQVALYDLECIRPDTLNVPNEFFSTKDIWKATCIMSKDVYTMYTEDVIKSKVLIPDLGRMYKYARKLNIPIQNLFDIKDIVKAVGADVTTEELGSILESLPEGVDYTLIERLRGGTPLNLFT